MQIPTTYIQQIAYNGVDYSKGTLVDILEAFGVGCIDFPFKLFPESKDLATNDWSDENGVDVYVPDVLPLADYDIDVEFVCKGTDEDIRTNIRKFLSFLYGRTKGGVSDEVQSGRLAVLNEHTGIGRKDIVVASVSPEMFYSSEFDADAAAHFNVKFHVYDPVTDVSVQTSSSAGVTTKTLVW